MMPSMGVPQAGAAGFTSQQPPIKNMRPMNPQAGHHMHPQHTQPQWGHNQYVSPTSFFFLHCTMRRNVNCHLIH